MELRYTRHQVARGTRPDAEIDGKLYLLKNVSILHATYQVRLLAFLAREKGKKLIIRVPKHFKPGPSLKRLMEDNPDLVRVEKV